MSEKKVVRRSVAIALGIICIILVVGLVGVFAYVESQIAELQSQMNQTAPEIYTIWREGDTYYARNANGTLTFWNTNATKVIQSAIDALTVGRTYKEMITLKGDFTISSPIIIKSYTLLDFEGKVTVADNADLDAAIKSEGFEKLNGTNSSGGVIEAEIDGLELDGNKAEQTSNFGNGIELYGRRLVLRDVNVYDCRGDGIWTEWSTNSTVSNPNDAMEGLFSNVRSSFNGGRGWRMLGPHDSYLENILLYCNGQVGFASWGGGGCQGVNLHAYGNGQAGFYIDANGTMFTNIISESNNEDGVVVLAHDVYLEGSFYNNKRYGILMGNATGRYPAGCYIQGKTLGNGYAGLMLVRGNINHYELHMWERNAVNGTLNVNDTYMIYDTMTGQRSQNSGNATILKGNRSVTIPHMLIGTPRIVIITGTDSETAGAYVSARNATDITITVPNPVTVDSEIDWQAQV